MSAPVERALRDVTLFPLWPDNPAAPTPERPLSDPQAALGQGRRERLFLADSRRSAMRTPEVLVGSESDERGHHQRGLLLGVKQTHSARKRTWGSNVGCWG